MVKALTSLTNRSEARGSGTTRRSIWIRIALSAAILGALVVGIGPDKIASGAMALDATTLLLVLPVVFLQVLLVTCRWHLIGAALGMAVPYRRLLEIQSLSGLIGNVLPTSVGASALRVFLTYREGVPFAKAASSIVIDRVIAMVILLFMVVVAQPLLLAWIGPIAPPRWLIWVAGGMLLAAVLGGYLLLPILTAKMTRVWDVLRAMAQEAQAFSTKATALTVTLVIAAVAQLLLFVVAFLLGTGLGIELSLLHYLLLMPSVALLASLPVALGGWGVREGSLVAGLMLFQVPPEKSLLLGLTIGLVSLTALIPGALLSLARRTRNQNGGAVAPSIDAAQHGSRAH